MLIKTKQSSWKWDYLKSTVRWSVINWLYQSLSLQPGEGRPPSLLSSPLSFFLSFQLQPWGHSVSSHHEKKKNHTKISKSVSWGKLRPYPRSPHVTWQHLFWSLLSWPLHTPWTYTLRWLAFRSLVPRAHSGSCGMTAMALTTALWLDLRPTPQEKIHICYCEQGQKPIAREATDSKGRNYYCCSRWNSSRSSVSRETSPLLT